MKTARALPLAAAVTAVLLLAGVARGQTNPCNAAKLKTAGKKAGSKTTCRAKAVGKGIVPVDSTCLAKTEVKFSQYYAKLEARALATGAPCLTTGDAAPIEAKIDTLIDDVAAQLSEAGPSKCESGKWKAVGKKVVGKLNCHSKAVSRAILVDSTCLAKTEIKFSSAFAKLDLRGTCAGDASGTEGIIDAGVEDIAGELGSATNLCPDCCAFTRFAFTTGQPAPGSTCGYVSPARCIGGDTPGSACTDDLDCPNGDCRGELDCGALYVGGSQVGMPLPLPVPDLGQSILSVTTCNAGTTLYTLAATSAADTGSIRTCTSGGEPNPDYPACVGGSTPGQPCHSAGECSGGTCTGSLTGCLLGAPQPVVNIDTPSTSTCVVSRIVSDASGSGACSGVTNVSFDLAADVYLTYDLALTVTGIQPCPVCLSNVCQGGPNNGLSCAPGSSALGDAFPTSHDCPPPGNYRIATLTLPFALSTGSPDLSATDTDGAGGQTNVFCGFCRNDTSMAFQNPPVACTDNAGCTDPGFTVCQQRAEGAFGNAEADDLYMSGKLPTACLSDGSAQPARLASVFCLPPSYNGLLDATWNIPGPGAVTLPGTAQLLP